MGKVVMKILQSSALGLKRLWDRAWICNFPTVKLVLFTVSKPFTLNSHTACVVYTVVWNLLIEYICLQKQIPLQNAFRHKSTIIQYIYMVDRKK